MVSALNRQMSLMLLAAVLAGCGGTWTNDSGNFERVFGFSKPKDVQVLHSYYWKSPHWTTEYTYFIELSASQGFTNGLTSMMLPAPIALDGGESNSCGSPRPRWFLPKPLTSYETWMPKAAEGYRVYRDKDEGTLFLCGERL